MARRLMFATALCLASTAGWAVEPFSAQYRANYMGMQGNGRMTLQPAGAGRWRYSLDVTGMGARLSQSTTFEEHGGRWRPVSSSDSQAGESGLAAMLVKKRSVEATYDWNKGEARWSGDVDEDEAGPVVLRAGDMDGMLMNLALVRDVAAGEPLEYRLVEDGRAKPQKFRVDGTESIDVAGESKQATRVVREDGSRKITAWIVDGMPVPARILQQRRGRDHIDLQLQSIQ
ncbi:DUF3108 domain-containing protein [Luteimonas sp. SJ-92]|uniref:DUF3108 domain-containing protein n=2 Tax=Luteimonas salinisoli TaxID=2752307 RepID=A0A853JDT1_9GAMM|nr:DUF3108 domain-containing protein [Luteimonas salinisoli]